MLRPLQFLDVLKKKINEFLTISFLFFTNYKKPFQFLDILNLFFNCFLTVSIPFFFTKFAIFDILNISYQVLNNFFLLYYNFPNFGYFEHFLTISIPISQNFLKPLQFFLWNFNNFFSQNLLKTFPIFGYFKHFFKNIFF